MSEVDIQQELARLAERLARIEHHLGISSHTSESRALPHSDELARSLPPDDKSIHAAAPTSIEQIEISVPPFTQAPPTTKAEALSRLQSAWKSKDGDEIEDEAAAPQQHIAAPPIIAAPLPSAGEFVPAGLEAELDPASDSPGNSASPEHRAPLEVLIGGKWMAWVGAIVVVLAAGFAVKVGIDMGWWGRISPTMRCLIIAAFGGAMLTCGEVALRRFGRAASVGLFSAGLGTLYLDAFATARFFHIVSSEVSFVLMGVVALGGFLITLRTRFLTIGVLSLLGGYLAPLLIGGQATLDLELLVYLTALLGIALALSAVMPRSFRALRYVALGGQAIVGLGWLIANASSQWIMAIIFLSLWWSMVLGESVMAALRRQSAVGNVVATVLTTTAYVTAGCWVLASAAAAPNASEWLGALTAMIAVLCMAAAVQFGPGLDGLRGGLQSAMDKLAVALWCQAGVLLAVAVALQFDGFGQSIAWLALGLAGVEIGRRLPSRGVTVFGLVIGILAFTRVVLIDWWITPGFAGEVWSYGDVRISQWAILALATILATHVAAHRLRIQSPAGGPILPIVLAAAATALWLLLSATHCKSLVMTTAWIIGAAAMFALEPLGRRQRYFEIGLFVLLIAAIKWLFLDGILIRMSPHWSGAERLFVLNWQMGVAALIAVMGWWAYRTLVKRESITSATQSSIDRTSSDAWQAMLIGGMLFVLTAFSFEVDRGVMQMSVNGFVGSWAVAHVRQLLLTLLWASGAFGLGIVGLATRRPQASNIDSSANIVVDVSWLMYAACAVKWVFIDVLYMSFAESHVLSSTGMPIVNLQLGVGMTLAIGALVLAFARRGTLGGTTRSVTAWVPVAAGAMVLWGLSFEVDRALDRFINAHGPPFFSEWNSSLRLALCLTALWSLGGWVMVTLGRARKLWTLCVGGAVTLLLASIAWLTADTLLPRIGEGLTAAVPVLNLQFAVGALLIALLAHTASSLGIGESFTPAIARHTLAQIVVVSLSLIALIVIWLGSLEIDRLLAHEPMSRQTGLSVYWGLCGTVFVVLGFAKRTAVCRYAGLTLLSITVLKVLFIDLAHVDNIARVISFLVSGLLLIATSILYTRLAPRLLAPARD